MNLQSASNCRQTALLLGNYRPTMPIARTLKDRGFKVIASSMGCDLGAENSRYVDGIWDQPPLTENPTEFIDALAAWARKTANLTLVVPVAEEYVRLFANQTIDLPASVHVATPDDALVSLCLDKIQLLTKAAAIGLPVAPFLLVDRIERILDAGTAFGYPLVIRPEHSTNRIFGKKAITVNSPQDIDALLPEWPHGHLNLLVQRKVSGIRHNLYFAANQGSLERVLHSKILRTDRLDGSGLAVEGLTIKPDPALLKFTQTLLSDLNYTGIGCAQFLVDDHAGDIHFLEINPRVAGNHVLPEYCGLGLGDWLIDHTCSPKSDVPVKQMGTIGVRYCWLAGDLQGLKMAWLQKELSVPQAIGWVFRALKTYLRSDLDIMLNWHDPKPGFIALLNVLFGQKSRAVLQRVSNHQLPSSPTHPLQPTRSTSP